MLKIFESQTNKYIFSDITDFAFSLLQIFCLTGIIESVKIKTVKGERQVKLYRYRKIESALAEIENGTGDKFKDIEFFQAEYEEYTQKIIIRKKNIFSDKNFSKANINYFTEDKL